MLEQLLLQDDTEERCGLILKDGAVVHLQNIAADKSSGFEMDPNEALPYIMTNQVVATWHTHPSGLSNLSGDDYEGFLGWPDLKHYVIAQNGVACYRVEQGSIIVCD